MPRRKITVEEALRALEEAGIPLQLKVVVQPTVLQEQKQVEPSSFTQQNATAVGKNVKIILFAKHSVGSGGTVTVMNGEKQMEDAGVQTYGPGVCTVPSVLASHLLHADQAARQADAKMLDREQHSYLVVQRQNPSGHLINVGVAVPNEVLDSGLGTIPQDFMFVIR